MGGDIRGRPFAHRSACVNVARTPCARVPRGQTVGACWRSDSPVGCRSARTARSSRPRPRAAPARVLAYLALHPGTARPRPARRALLARRARRVGPHQPARRADRAAPRARARGATSSSPAARRSRSTAPGSPSTRARSPRRSTPATPPSRWRRAARRSSTASTTTGPTTPVRRTRSGSPRRSSSSRATRASRRRGPPDARAGRARPARRGTEPRA